MTPADIFADLDRDLAHERAVIVSGYRARRVARWHMQAAVYRASVRLHEAGAA